MRDRRVWGAGAAMAVMLAGAFALANPPSSSPVATAKPPVTGAKTAPALKATPTPKPPNKASPSALTSKQGKATPTPAAVATPEEKGEEKPKVQEKVTIGVYLKELPDID